jgi:dTDP-4-amino-4,6-dideoxygalactose transaminase
MNLPETQIPLTVTRPLLPPLSELTPLLEDIWQRRWLTNNGVYHQKLESALRSYLKIPYISLWTNGTLPLLAALKLLDVRGEVITTPFTFAATAHAILWAGCEPVFADVDPGTGCIDSAKIEAAITERTGAIMAVHVYGTPCDTAAIQKIADKHSLRVIYDAAHAFGVERNGASILTEGDISTLSFHATKAVFNTIEGGALVCKDAGLQRQSELLKNFGFAGETEVVLAGMNGKMDEVRASYGLLNLKKVEEGIARREAIAGCYREALQTIPGIRLLHPMPGVKYNYAYFPVFIEEDEYGMSRDALYGKLKDNGIFGRRYFYPLVSDFLPYRGLPSARAENLRAAKQLASRVLCLPMYDTLDMGTVQRIAELVARGAD